MTARFRNVTSLPDDMDLDEDISWRTIYPPSFVAIAFIFSELWGQVVECHWKQKNPVWIGFTYKMFYSHLAYMIIFMPSDQEIAKTG